MFKKKPKAKNIRQSTTTSIHDEGKILFILVTLDFLPLLETYLPEIKSSYAVDTLLTLRKENKELNISSLDQSQIELSEINPFTTDGIPTAADIFLAKKKRAQLSKNHSDSQKSSKDSELEYISLDVDSNFPNSTIPFSSPIVGRLSPESSPLTQFRALQSNDSKLSSDYPNKLSFGKSKYDYGDVYDFVDINEELKTPIDDSQPVFVHSLVTEQNVSKPLPPKLSSTNELIELSEVDESDEEDLSWEYERLKNSGVNPNLYLKQKSPSHFIPKTFDSPLNSEMANMKSKIKVGLPNTLDVINSIQSAIKKNQEFIKLEEIKLSKLKSEISSTNSTISKIETDLVKCSSHMKNFNNLLSLVKN
ncbi:hypothetical protein AYI68_g2312 [Smittium mucronatum]|uniref:Uncharacterized protein n=1 Tax=Smittium mucronatum TaxID=133383 RepID=A0A1R0H379_9FUNG|nr:hypothetical protein AYI68_g2312 [Smittium mucronatum]